MARLTKKIFGSVRRKSSLVCQGATPPEKVTVWLGIGWNDFIGPFFWESDPLFPREKGITGRWYKQILETQRIPAMREGPNFRHLVFQHDGALPHFALQVRQLLDRVFPNRWMGRDKVVVILESRRTTY